MSVFFSWCTTLFRLPCWLLQTPSQQKYSHPLIKNWTSERESSNIEHMQSVHSLHWLPPLLVKKAAMFTFALVVGQPLPELVGCCCCYPSAGWGGAGAGRSTHHRLRRRCLSPSRSGDGARATACASANACRCPSGDADDDGAPCELGPRPGADWKPQATGRWGWMPRISWLTRSSVSRNKQDRSGN